MRPEENPLPPRRLERFGLRAHVPAGWECRITQRLESGEGEQTYPILHAATVPIPPARADYGGGVVENLGPTDVFVSLVEFGPDEASTELFPDVAELPVLELAMFHRNQLQRRIRGQAGMQRFFTLNRRPFCLYVVLGSVARAPQQVAKANALLTGLRIDEV